MATVVEGLGIVAVTMETSGAPDACVDDDDAEDEEDDGSDKAGDVEYAEPYPLLSNNCAEYADTSNDASYLLSNLLSVCCLA